MSVAEEDRDSRRSEEVKSEQKARMAADIYISTHQLTSKSGKRSTQH